MPTATVTSKGQITIPKEVRDLLHLNAGDRVSFLVQPDGQVILKPATIDVGELEGILQRNGRKPVTVEGMNAAIDRIFRKRT